MNTTRSTARARSALWGLLVAVPLAIAGFFGNPAPAKSLGVCGYVRWQTFTTTSVSVVSYCNNIDHARCEPGFPVVGPGGFFFGDYFICVDW